MKDKVIYWANQRDLIKKENSTVQIFKLIEESSEIFKAYLDNNVGEIKDGIGDTQIVIYILLEQLGIQEVIKPFEFNPQSVKSDLFEFHKAISNIVYSYNYIYKHEKVSISSINVALGYLQNIARYYNSSLEECLELAYNEIKNRKGETVNGTFIKNK